MKRIASFALCCSVFQSMGAQQPLQLWYDRPATVWEEMLPLGNGRLGMMSDGGFIDEKIVLNDITLWSGSEQDPNNYDAYKSVGRIQALLLQGRNDEAEQLVNANFVCVGEGSGHGKGANVPYGCFQTLGELQIRYDHQEGEVTDYRRHLDLPTATAETSYRRGGITYRREYLASFDGDVGVRSEEHTSELQSLMRISYAVFCLNNTNELVKTLHTTT